MSKSFITTFVRLAVRSTGKPSNTAAFAARNVRALNTSAISEPALVDNSSEISQQISPQYASKTSWSAKLRSALDNGAKTSAISRLESSGFELEDECQAAVLLNIENAQRSNDEEYVTDQIAKAFEIIAAMKGSHINGNEKVYGPLLNFLIDKKMVEEFHMLVEAMRDDSDHYWLREKLARLGYYKMLLWIKLKDEEKIKEVCSMIIKRFKEKIAVEKNCSKPPVIRRGWEIHRMELCNKQCPKLTKHYLLALCEKDQHKEVLRILETLDITRVESFRLWRSIFEHLGRSLAESVAKKLLRELNKNGLFYYIEHDVSELIFSYVTSIPNLSIGSAFFKFKELLKELDITPSTASYKKLIKYSCDSRKEEVGLSILQHMYEVGLEVPSDDAVYLFRTIEKNYGFNLVRGVEDVLTEMNKKGDKSRMFNLRLAEYILEVLFGGCERNQKEGDSYKPWLINNYFRCKLDDYKRKYPKS
ncbi:unnamed protein product [Arabidopsis halleri]